MPGVKLRKRPSKGLAETVMTVGIAIVTLFIVLFMIVKVAGITAIDSTSDFYQIYVDLTQNTQTIYSVLILVLIVAALAVAIWYLRTKFSGVAGGTSAV